MSGLKRQKRSAAMEHFAGLDVSIKETSVCVIDGASRMVREVKVPTEPDAGLLMICVDTRHMRAVLTSGSTG